MATATATATSTQFYLDDKWKLSKKEGGSASRFTRSSSSSSSSSATTAAAYQKKNQRHGRCAFSRKCARLFKEQRARFYIVRRCVIMLICWSDYSDS